MELWTLDGTFQPQDIVENYESLIWTERYSVNGDFELQTSAVEETLNALPLDSFITIRESTVPMVVETQKIEKAKNAAPLLTVTGRSFETVMERRASVRGALPSATPRQAWTDLAMKSSDAAYHVMRTVLGDIARFKEGVQMTAATSVADMASPLDAIPQIDLVLPADFELLDIPAPWNSATTYPVGYRVLQAKSIWIAIATNTNKPPSPVNSAYWKMTTPQVSFDVPVQDLYKTVTEFLELNRHGLRAVRPLDGNKLQAAIEIYNGANLTGEGANASSEVYVFDAKFDQFDSSTYLLSEAGSTNVGYVFGGDGSEIINKTASAEPSGLDRRVVAVPDAGGTVDARRSKGLVVLYQNNVTAMFDGEVADQVSDDFNRKYFLGDILGMHGEYGLKSYVRVSEYIRTEDSTGESAYPTLEVVEID